MTIAKVDLAGNDLRSNRTSNYQSCCSWCQNYPGCRAYTWIIAPGLFYGMCYLKSSAAGAGGPSTDHISAYYWTIRIIHSRNPCWKFETEGSIKVRKRHVSVGTEPYHHLLYRNGCYKERSWKESVHVSPAIIFSGLGMWDSHVSVIDSKKLFSTISLGGSHEWPTNRGSGTGVRWCIIGLSSSEAWKDRSFWFWWRSCIILPARFIAGLSLAFIVSVHAARTQTLLKHRRLCDIILAYFSFMECISDYFSWHVQADEWAIRVSKAPVFERENICY